MTATHCQTFDVLRSHASDASEPSEPSEPSERVTEPGFNLLTEEAMAKTFRDIAEKRGWSPEDRLVANGSLGDVVIYEKGKVRLVSTE